MDAGYELISPPLEISLPMRLSHESVPSSRHRDILTAWRVGFPHVGVPNREIGFVRQPPIGQYALVEPGALDAMTVEGPEDHFRGLSVRAGATAVAGASGVICVLAGLDKRLGGDRAHWFAFDNSLLEAASFTAVVVVPNVVVTRYALRRDERADRAAVVAGGLLLGAFAYKARKLKRITWIDPLFVLGGVALVIDGRRVLVPRQSDRSDESASHTEPSHIEHVADAAEARSAEALHVASDAFRPLSRAASRLARPLDTLRERAVPRRLRHAP
jgi:hypothetical protein